MTDMNDVNDSSTQGLPENFETPGAILKAAREKAGLAAGDLARQLNLSEAKLLSLEEDQYDKLASDVFAQGYLRRYAKLLGLDDDLIVQRFNEYQTLLRQGEQGVEGEETTTSAAGALPRWLLPAAILILAVAVLAFIYMRTVGGDAKGPIVGPVQQAPIANAQIEELAEQQAEEPQIEQPAPAQAEPSVNEAPVNEEPQPEAPADTAVTSLPASEPSSVIAANEAAGNPEIEAAADFQVAALDPQAADVSADGEDVLSFAFSDECWVEVSNAQGTVIYADLARAGQTLSVEGEAPFSVMLGNARAVSLTYKGELVSVNPRAGNRTARLTVGG